VNWRRPGGPGWAGRSGQSAVVSWGGLCTNATHIVKGKYWLRTGGAGQTRNPKAEIRRKSEARNPKADAARSAGWSPRALELPRSRPGPGGGGAGRWFARLQSPMKARSLAGEIRSGAARAYSGKIHRLALRSEVQSTGKSLFGIWIVTGIDSAGFGFALAMRVVKATLQSAALACKPGCWWAGRGPDHRTKAAGHGAADVNRPAGLLPSIPANVLAPVSPAHDACPAVASAEADGTWRPDIGCAACAALGDSARAGAGLSRKMHQVTG